MLCRLHCEIWDNIDQAQSNTDVLPKSLALLTQESFKSFYQYLRLEQSKMVDIFQTTFSNAYLYSYGNSYAVNGVGGAVRFLVVGTISKDHHGVSSGWSCTWFHSKTGLPSTQYEQMPIIFGVWPFWLTPFFFRSITFWRFMVKLYFICWNYPLSSGWHIIAA